MYGVQPINGLWALGKTVYCAMLGAITLDVSHMDWTPLSGTTIALSKMFCREEVCAQMFA